MNVEEMVALMEQRLPPEGGFEMVQLSDYELRAHGIDDPADEIDAALGDKDKDPNVLLTIKVPGGTIEIG